MKSRILQLVLCFASIGGAFAGEPEDPINERYSGVIEAERIEAADLEWLVKKSAGGGIDECIAVAVLFRSDQEQYSDDFAKYFHLKKVDDPIILSEEEVNKEVNQVIQMYRGRSPIEIASRVYLRFRGSNKVITRGDSRIYLEMVFRASVLTGIIKPTEENLMKLSALVDSPIKD